MPYPRGFRDISPIGRELEKCGGGNAGASPKRGGLKPTYLGRFRGGARKPLVNRVSPDTLPASPLFIRASEAFARKRPIHTGLRAALFKSQTIYSGSTLPKDKAVILAKEAAINSPYGVTIYNAASSVSRLAATMMSRSASLST